VTTEMDDLIIRRIFNCSKRFLFDAWSQPAIMSKWLFARRFEFTESTVVNSFTVGGKYAITMHMPSADVKLFGSYIEINRYSRISFSWSSPTVSNSRVTLDFKGLSINRTELTLTHTLLPTQELRQQHQEGWQACFDNLEDRIIAPDRNM